MPAQYTPFHTTTNNHLTNTSFRFGVELKKNMNRQVPGSLHMEDVNYSNPATHRPKNPASDGARVAELLWENGHVVMQNNRQQKNTASAAAGGEAVIQPEREIRLGGDEQQQNQQLFMQDDEMASWLQYPLEDLYADLLYPSPPTLAPVSTVTQAEIQYPAPTYEGSDNAPRVQNFGHFSRLPGRPRILESVNQLPATEVRESTVVESNDTPMVRLPEPRVSSVVNVESGAAMAGGTSVAVGELGAGICEPTVTSSASLSVSGEAQMRPEGRKRRARENSDNEYQSEDTEFEADEAKEPAHGPLSAKRSRAAEVHNLSERKRRDKINVKMRALQDLIPRCKKTDKASMLDDAIDYVKSLQMQLQLMSMGFPMVPMMYPGMQQYMTAMGLSMGMNRPMVPYHPPMPPCSTMPNPAYTSPRLPMLSTYPMPLVHTSDPGIQGSGSNQVDHVVNFSQYQNQPGLSNFADLYQQFVGMHQGQYPIPQNQQVLQPGSNRPITGEDTCNPDTQIG